MFALLNGGEKNTSEYQGKVILLDFMGANCYPCQLQLIQLEYLSKSLSENYADEDFEIVSIDVWVVSGETADTLQGLIDDLHVQYGLDLDWTFGLDDEIGTLYSKYASGGVPRIYILDENGNIYYDSGQSGLTDYRVLEAEMDKLLG